MSLLKSQRPAREKRLFTSPVVEEAIAETTAKIADRELAWLFENCFPNTLDTTVFHTPGDGRAGGSGGAGYPDTYVITGDIDAMWLRDSTNQVWPYLPFAARCRKLQAMFRGLIRRQCQCVLLDPYANAFYRQLGGAGGGSGAGQGAAKVSPWKSDQTEMRAGVHERKYELDSLASVLRLAVGYFEATQDATIFEPTVISAFELLVQTIQNEQAGTPEQINPPYSFARHAANASDTLSGGGHGHPCRRTGMSRSPFRPSDDAAVFQYSIPANALTVVVLRKLADILLKLRLAPELAAGSITRSFEIERGLRTHGIVPHPTLGPMFAYEVDGYGSAVMMDDAGPPSLLALPYLGYCGAGDAVYAHTRSFILSAENPYYHSGKAASGVGSAHVGMGWIWPLGIITQAMTSTDDGEVLGCLRTLRATHGGTGFMHEAFWMDDGGQFTRPWFAWANSYFGELILQVARVRPHLLAEKMA